MNDETTMPAAPAPPVEKTSAQLDAEMERIADLVEDRDRLRGALHKVEAAIKGVPVLPNRHARRAASAQRRRDARAAERRELRDVVPPVVVAPLVQNAARDAAGNRISGLRSLKREEARRARKAAVVEVAAP